MSLPKSFPIRATGGKTIQIPSVGYGTWASGDTSWAKDAVLTALKAGYRHLDCAWMYGVDEPVGAAIKESGIPREEIFVTTKVYYFSPPYHEHGADQVTVLASLWSPRQCRAMPRQDPQEHGPGVRRPLPLALAMCLQACLS